MIETYLEILLLANQIYMGKPSFFGIGTNRPVFISRVCLHQLSVVVDHMNCYCYVSTRQSLSSANLAELQLPSYTRR